MLSKFQKKIFFLSFVTIGVFGFFLSCDNPFTNNMGGKVDVAAPIVTMNPSPNVNTFLKGDSVVFSGTASAYREIRYVEVKIHTSKKGGDRVDWTAVDYFFKESETTARWSYTVDTTEYNDGAFVIQFRARDPRINGETVKMTYLIKNNSSDVILTAPVYTSQSAEAGSLQIKSSIRGQIVDNRGIKPGYPQIKIWPVGNGPGEYAKDDEPADNDPRYGYATLFLVGLDNPDTPDGHGRQGAYINRSQMQRVTDAQFEFPLFEFVLVDSEHYSDTREIRYKLDTTGKRTAYPAGTRMSFRIKTSDAFYDENYFPVAPPAGEKEAIGFFPPHGWGESYEDSSVRRDEPASVLLTSTEGPVVIRIDNDDLGTDSINPDPGQERILQSHPHIYMIDGVINRKIDRPQGQDEFRFRVLGKHSDDIAYAELRYSHPSKGTGTLDWDADKGGSAGQDKVLGDSRGSGKVFTYTYNGAGNIFSPSTEPYTLTATIYAMGGVNSATFSREVYIDGNGPAVRIQSARGTVSEPASSSVTYNSTTDTAVNTAGIYTVNGNVQFAISFFDDITRLNYSGDDAGLGERPPQNHPSYPGGSNYPMVKWFVEKTAPSDAGSMEKQIEKFRGTLKKEDLLFFESIGETYCSGWLSPPQDKANIPAEDRSWNFKLNTQQSDWDGKDLYVYVIAQDDARNLGYILQKIHVDDSTDKPALEIQGLSADIDDESKLDAIFTGDPNSPIDWNKWTRRNILEQDQGIPLYLNDDDGIRLIQGDVQMYLTDLNGRFSAAESSKQIPTRLIERTFSGTGVSKDWWGTLSQPIMAEALYGTGTTAPPGTTVPQHLPDGIYKIEITINDDVISKVSIDRTPPRPGDVPVAASAPSQIYYFAVFTMLPEIDFNPETPREGLLVNDAVAHCISGTVKSQLDIKRVSITFTPNVNQGNPTIDLTPFLIRQSQNPPDATTSYYHVYTWEVDPKINFAPAHLPDDGPRTFTVKAYDRPGYMGSQSRTVRVDKKPPSVSRVSFNYDRDGAVYNLVPFTISVSDDNSGLYDYRSDPTADPANPRPAIRWWVCSINDPQPSKDDYRVASGPNGTAISGRFLPEDAQNGRYSGVFDSRLLPNGDNYALYVIAEDNAGNFNWNSTNPSPCRIVTFDIDQDADYPAVDPGITIDLNGEKSNGTGPGSVVSQANLLIKGIVTDNDLFDAGKFEAGKQPYVQIRFPGTTDANGLPITWGAWLPVSGKLDQMGRIEFTYAGASADADVTAYFNEKTKSTYKHYQIQVRDEDVATAINTTTFKGSGGNYGKNPLGTPGGIGSVSRIFPGSFVGKDWTPTYYSFVLDNGPPEILFASHDPNEDHPGYSSDRPTFQTLQQFVDALEGTVEEPNLEFLSFSYGGETVELYRRESATAAVSSFPWTLYLNPDAITLVTEAFEAAGQGPQSVTLEARDIANNQIRVNWMFYKDTQGPSIIPGIITAIPTPDFTISGNTVYPNGLTPASFPANWPSDWPSDASNANWKTDPAWAALRNFGVESWPSEFKFYTEFEKIIAELMANHLRTREGELSVVSDARGDAVISGRFQDEYSFLDGTFEYRFNNAKGRLDELGWSDPVPLGLTAEQKSATWSIKIADAIKDNNFSGLDGVNILDIKVKDKAGNESAVYGLQFVLDRNDPYFISQDARYPKHNDSDGFGIQLTSTATPKFLSETERVFSASSASAGPYTLSGAVHDYNLKNLTIIISQEAASLGAGYSLAISHDVTTNTFTNTPATDTAQRLTVERQGADSPMWHWTLTILEKDIAELKKTNPNQGVRHYVTLNATDKAGRRVASQPVAWNFYLDTESPAIQYYVPASANPQNTFSVFDLSATSGDFFELSGTASDATKIRNVQYSIARFDYAAGEWRWYSTAGSGGWTLTSQPDPEEWPSAISYPNNVAMAESMVSWSITQDRLNASGKYPKDFFANTNSPSPDQEGQYKVDLYVTDWSQGGVKPGNPADTRNDNTFGSDIAKNNSARKFFVDTAAPLIVWDSSTDGKQYFKNDLNGQVEFKFTVTDNNTVPIENIEAAVFNATGTGTPVVPRFRLATSSNTSVVEVNQVSLVKSNVTVRPTMTTNQQSTGTALDMVGGNTAPITYTLKLYVRDAAGVEATSLNTKQFILDNVKPKLPSITPVTIRTDGGFNTIYGGVTIRGNTTDNSSLISRVAFYVANESNGFAAPAMYNSADGSIIYKSDGTLDWSGWYWGTGATPSYSPPYRIYDDATKTELMFIDSGTFTWEIKIPKTRNFLSHFGLKYIDGGFKTVQGSDNYFDTNGKLPAGESIGNVKIWFLAMDEAGNIKIEPYGYWVYPEGDRPVITAINNPNQTTIEAERLLNGNIRVSGLARDNENIHSVWFRVLNDNVGESGYGQPYTLQIPRWNETTWEQQGTDMQTGWKPSSEIGSTFTGDVAGEGWYMANRGGNNETSASWWVYINREGELNRVSGSGANRIKIEVRAQDATRNTAGNWSTDGSMLSRANTVTAFVVTDAPTFVDERVVVLNSSNNYAYPTTYPNGWGEILKTSIRKRGAYRVVVKDNVGISQIRWTPTKYENGTFKPDTAADVINILDPSYIATYNTHLNEVNAGTRGMALKADPNPNYLRSGISLDSSKTYIVWKWHDNLAGSSLLNIDLATADPENKRTDSYMRFTVITGKSGNIGGAQVIERDNDGLYQWVVTIDVNTTKLATDMNMGSNAFFSRQYEVYLSASDASKPTALTSARTALLPLDTSPPYAQYTLNRRPAGLSQAIGGTAGDATPVGGIARVVLWFSRLEDDAARTRKFISWRENPVTIGGTPLTPPSVTFRQYNGSTDANKWFDELDPGVIPSVGPDGKPIQVPFIPPEDSGAGNWDGAYAIVIDRNNPLTGTWHHGHNLSMGFSSGGLGKEWYVELNSFGLTSGPVTMHYVVIDTAGNARYYAEPLLVMNNAPLIKEIQLGTDIRGLSTFGSGSNGFPNNMKWANGQPDGNAPLDRIRNQVSGTNNTTTRGISDPIAASALTANNIIDFNVRNKLLALRMETTGVPQEKKKRSYRLEYVYEANYVTDIRDVKAGRVYIVDSDPQNTSASLSGLGATGNGPWVRGYAFLAAANGRWDESEMGPLPTMKLWELNSTSPPVYSPIYIPDAEYQPAANNTNAKSAEFAYASTAFGDTNATIIDWGGSEVWPSVAGVNPPQNHSLFILRVFDGVEEDIFSDFALIRIRVNNNDKTLPFAQLYDINPNTEGQTRFQSEAASLSPMSIGDNRTRGGLWNTNTDDYHDVTRPGHIEPRRIDSYNIAPYSTWRHSLSPVEMGGITGYSGIRDNTGQTVNYNGFFTRDTVSGEVILRGYVEDDQRINKVVLQFASSEITILEYATATESAGNPDQGIPATTGLLKVPEAQAGKVYYHDTIDTRRHRVEWAYKWDTQAVPTGVVVGDNISVRAIAYNRNSIPAPSAEIEEASGTAHTETGPSYRINNPGFPVGLKKYNRIAFDLRPYITGFRRDQSKFFHDTRSLQGRYLLSREEEVIVTGFNLSKNGTSDTTLTSDGTVCLPGVDVETRKPTATEAANYGLGVNPAYYRYRFLKIPATAKSTATDNANGVVTLKASGVSAVNTRIGNVGERPLLNATGGTTGTLNTHWVQPWNRESFEGIAGSDLWEDFIAVHIWQSNDTAPGTNTTNNGYFRSRNDNWVVLNPSMSIDPANGRLYASYNEGGGEVSNSGNTWTSTNYQDGSNTRVQQFIDPIIHSDIYRSPGGPGQAADTWVVSSIIGRESSSNEWYALGGVWIKGPNGSNISFFGGNDATRENNYHGESTWYNASTVSGTGPTWGNNNPGATVHYPPATDQFMNPHIVTSYASNNNEYIHVSYYDSKDGSIKYRYNQRGLAGRIDTSGFIVQKDWVNLDGGYDEDDTPGTDAVSGVGNRIVNYNVRKGLAVAQRPNAGEHNAIATTSEGYPVIAYYDATNQRLKMAVSKTYSPRANSDWVIRDYVIPRGNLVSFGTGQFVSMRIDHGRTNSATMKNRVHIAALNSVTNQLVYIRGRITIPSSWPGNTVQEETTGNNVFTIDAGYPKVVDSVGTVGRWSTISLDADGNPWIAYMDEANRGSMDGVKLAYFNEAAFKKELNDPYGNDITGWETMHVPARYRVENQIIDGRENGRLGLENFPTRNVAPSASATQFWSGAVSYLGNNGSSIRYRIAYYVQ